MQNRPVYINVFTFAFPITAIISLFHRLSGLLVFVMLPQLLSLLHNALYGPLMLHSSTKFLSWITLCALSYHLFAGIRHLCMDAGFGEDKKAYTASSYVVLIATFIACVLIGLRLW